MRILAVETSMGPASAALLIREGASMTVHEAPAKPSLEPAEALLPMIADLMADTGTGFADLTRLAVCVGPGSFTGIRAGLAAVRGLRLALGLPVVSATGFAIMAQRIVRERAPMGRFAIASSAGRDGLYVQVFAADGVAANDLRIMTPEDAALNVPEDVCAIAGPAAGALADAVSAPGRVREGLHVWPDIAPLASTLALMAATGEADRHPPSALYIKPADAKPQVPPALLKAGG
jgi:tRNA threonylcarbamoyladenosine biosynthesis protein TsaB